MAFPLAPVNGQTHIESSNGRKWKYSSSLSAWAPLERSDLDDLDDVDLTTSAPTNSQPLVYNGTQWVPQATPTTGAFVPLLKRTADPTNGLTDTASAGTIWRNTTTNKAWMSTQLTNSVGVTVVQADSVTNPAGTTAYSGGSPWGINFVSAFDFNCNSAGLYITSCTGAGSNIFARLYSGFNAAGTLLSTSSTVTTATTFTNTWKDVTFPSSIALTAGTQYSLVFTTDVGSGNHFVGTNTASFLFDTAFDHDGDNDASIIAMRNNGHVPSIRVGVKRTTAGTVWWPIANFIGDALWALDRLATPPAAPVDGQVYYNTAVSAVFVYDSTNGNWVQCIN